MTSENQKIDLIDAYLRQRLSKDETRQFENQLKADASLQEDLQDYDFIHKGFKGLELESFQNRLKTLEKNNLPNQHSGVYSQSPSLSKTTVGISWQRYAAAAAILFMIPVMWYGMTALNSTKGSMALFNEYHTPLQTNGVVRATDGNSDNLFQQGMSAFSLGKFDKALNFFNQYAENTSNQTIWREESTFYKAASLFELKKYGEAEKILLELSNKNSFGHREEAEWLLTLSALQADNTELVRQRINVILNANHHDYRKVAEKLLEEL